MTTPFTIASLGSLSYLGIFGISILANVVVPVPEEIILIGLGYIARGGHINVFYVVPIAIAGLLISDTIMYILSRRGNKLINHFFDRFFAKRLATRREWMEHNIEKVVFYSRFLIQLRFIGPFMAGQTNMSFRKFITYELAALLVYVQVTIWTGWLFRSSIERITYGLNVVRNGILILIVIAIGISIAKYLRRVLFTRPN